MWVAGKTQSAEDMAVLGDWRGPVLLVGLRSAGCYRRVRKQGRGWVVISLQRCLVQSMHVMMGGYGWFRVPELPRTTSGASRLGSGLVATFFMSKRWLTHRAMATLAWRPDCWM